MPNSPNSSLVSMGIHIFSMDVLQQALHEDSEVEASHALW